MLVDLKMACVRIFVRWIRSQNRSWRNFTDSLNMLKYIAVFQRISLKNLYTDGCGNKPRFLGDRKMIPCASSSWFGGMLRGLGHSSGWSSDYSGPKTEMENAMRIFPYEIGCYTPERFRSKLPRSVDQSTREASRFSWDYRGEEKSHILKDDNYGSI